MNKPPLRIYSRIPMDWNASFYYRILLPLRTLFNTGLAEVSVDRGDIGISNEIRQNMATYSSITWMYQPTSPDIPAACDEARKWPSYWRTEQEWDVAPHFVIDTDDDILNVLPDNPAYLNLGWKLGDSPLEKGAVISGEDENGKREPKFVDGSNGFSVTENKARIDNFRLALQRCDLVTCSTPNVEEYVRREAPSTQTLVTPNCIDFNDYPPVELADHDVVRILWQGSPTHQPELYAVKDALKRILDKYGKKIELLFWGDPLPWMAKFLEGAENVRFLPWVDYPEFKLRLSMINHDINIAPLTENIFNRCRSAIKFYESAAISKPAVTLAENAGAFGEIIENETGLLYNSPEEFEDKLSFLIEDAAARKRMASNAKDWLRENRDPKIWAPRIAEAFERLRIGRRALVGEPPKPQPLIESPNAEPIPAEQPNPS